jgi:hypothetical protein
MRIIYNVTQDDEVPVFKTEPLQNTVTVPEVIIAKPDLTIEGIKQPEEVPEFIDIETAEKVLANDFPIPDNVIVLPISKFEHPEVFEKTAEVKKALPDIPVDEIIEVVKAEVTVQKNAAEISEKVQALPKPKSFIDKLTNYIYKIFYK